MSTFFCLIRNSSSSFLLEILSAFVYRIFKFDFFNTSLVFSLLFFLVAFLDLGGTMLLWFFDWIDLFCCVSHSCSFFNFSWSALLIIFPLKIITSSFFSRLLISSCLRFLSSICCCFVRSSLRPILLFTW